MILGERIKKVRRDKNLTQYEFGKRIGIKANSVSLIESGNRNASDQVIISICREFNVDETWLRTGEGEMFLKTPDTAIGQLAKELGLDAFMQGVVSEYLKLNTEQRRTVHDFVCSIAAEAERAEPFAPATDYEAEARAEAEAYYRKILAEKAAKAPAPDAASEIEDLKRRIDVLEKEEDEAELQQTQPVGSISRSQ